MSKTDSPALNRRQLAEELARIKMGAKRDRAPSLLANLIRARAQFVAEKSEDLTKEKDLLDKIETLSTELATARIEKKKKEETISKLQAALSEFQKQEDIKYLLGKINKNAENKIRTDPDFLAEFAAGKRHNAFVVSVDIRSSTDLMLNAKSPDAFASFISILCDRLTGLVIDNGGVFDKFTGDGVLAFFPEFYSGDDAGYRALAMASDAIIFFEKHYKTNRDSFRVVIANTGLGVGIDYGSVHFVNIGASLSIVGNPVVYACRFAATEAGSICINQPAKELIMSKYPACTTVNEMTINIKSSGPVYANRVELKGTRLKCADLPWETK
jgi:class 3 adenylate cyclase